MPWKPDVVLFHGPGCLDGFGAAFAAWLKWGSEGIDYIPCTYGVSLPEVFDRCAGKHVLIVDFSFKHHEMVELGKLVKTCIVLDHHKSAEAELAEWRVSVAPGRFHELCSGLEHDGDILPIRAIFDMEKSGTRLAWEFCHPGTDVPWLLRHIEDRDLWRFDLRGTKEINAALHSHPLEFELWARFAEYPGKLEDEGESILRAHSKHVTDFCRNAYFEEIGGYRVPVLNVPYPFVSDCGHELLKLHPEAPFAACWTRVGDKLKYSLRSENSRMDVSEVAENLGGGGHRNSAGFETSV